MEQYPSIDKIIRNIPIFAYDKLDGSNFRVEWNRKTGFTKYGSRRQLIDTTHPMLGEAIPLFNETFADELESVFRKNQFQRATAFLEFYGPNSFAGFHEDEPHQLALFDVHVYKKGLLAPKEFNKLFVNVPTPELLYTGNPTEGFIQDVKNGVLPGMTFEGVVCKSGYDKKNKLGNFKVKNRAWLDKLRNRFADDERMFNALA